MSVNLEIKGVFRELKITERQNIYSLSLKDCFLETGLDHFAVNSYF